MVFELRIWALGVQGLGPKGLCLRMLTEGLRRTFSWNPPAALHKLLVPLHFEQHLSGRGSGVDSATTLLSRLAEQL